ncbi:MAG: NAD-dependent epimerase/dehydratase family protein, partial [Planctomycetota bacterium]
MRVVITGGGGFLGHQLCEALLRSGQLIGRDSQRVSIERIVLLDGVFSRPLPGSDPTVLPGGVPMEKIPVETVVGSIESQEAIDHAIGLGAASQGADVSIFHLASMVSGECEERFDDAMSVNLQGGLRLLEAARRFGPGCR